LQNEQNPSIVRLAKEIALIELCASASPSEAPPENGATKFAVILYTSGATGPSKGGRPVGARLQ
jgi:acyl-coenzyme A synthetase/AMP-(fatty) acid ligase